MTRKASRRQREQLRGAAIVPQHWHGEVSPGEEEVGIDFVCLRGHAVEIVGQFRMSTADGVDRAVTCRPLPDGLLPIEAGRPEGEAKALLICVVCGHERQRASAWIQEQLASMWAPHGRRVVSMPI